MPRPKKKKLESSTRAPPEPPAPAEPPAPPLAPPTPPRPTKMLAPESPSKTVLQQAQRKARILAKKKDSEFTKLVIKHEKALVLAERIFAAKMRRIELESKWKPPRRVLDPFNGLKRITKAELELQEARYTRLGVLLLACEADAEVLRAQGAAKDVKIARLKRQLHRLPGARGGRGVDGAPRVLGFESERDSECFRQVSTMFFHLPSFILRHTVTEKSC